MYENTSIHWYFSSFPMHLRFSFFYFILFLDFFLSCQVGSIQFFFCSVQLQFETTTFIAFLAYKSDQRVEIYRYNMEKYLNFSMLRVYIPIQLCIYISVILYAKYRFYITEFYWIHNTCIPTQCRMEKKDLVFY